MAKFFFLQVLFIFASVALFFVCAQETPQAPPLEEQPLQEAPQPATPQQQPAQPPAAKANENLDIVFLIDSSKSMTYTDPEEFRKVAVKAFLDITQDRGGDRIAVFQFAGWNETEPQGAVVFPLTEIPSDEAEREKVLSEAKEAIKTKITPFGKATDFNYAFQKCVLEIIQKRNEENAANKLWVLLLTDGEMDVVEGEVRPAYVTKAKADQPQGAKINREMLNKAATEMFEAEVIPALLAAEKNLFITCINLSSAESDILKMLSKKLSEEKCKIISTPRFDLESYVDVSNVKERYEPGQEIILQVGLKSANTFDFIKNPLIIKDSDIIIKPVDPQGVHHTRTIVSFADVPVAKKDIAYKIDEKSIGGKWSFNISSGVIRHTPTGRYAYESAPVRVSTTITSPIIEAKFTEKEAFAGQKIPITGRVTAGALSEDDIDKMPFTLTASNQKSGSTVDAKLDYNRQSETFSSTISLSESGEWKVKETPANFGKIVSPPDVIISVRDRSIRIFKMVDNKRQPISEIVVTAKDGFLGESIIVQPDLAPSETAEVSVSYSAAPKKEHTASFRVDQTEAKEAKYNITGKTPEKLVSLKIFRKPPSGREPDGFVTITCKIVGIEAPLAREISVICIPAEKGFPLWAILSICAGAVVILLLLWQYLSLPKFTGQQLILRNWPPYLLRDMRVSRRTAVGTEQLPGSLLFKLRGLKRFPRCAVLPKRNFILFVDGGLKSAWTALTHGCEISVQTADGREKFNYKYFDRPPTAQELETVPEGVLLGEDDFILAEDEDLIGKKEEVIPFARAIEKEEAVAAAPPAAEPPPTTTAPTEEPTEILFETKPEEEPRPTETAEELISAEPTEILTEEGEEPQIEPTLPGAVEAAATEPTQVLTGETPAEEEPALEKEVAEAFKELEEFIEPAKPSKPPEVEGEVTEEIAQAKESALEQEEGGETKPAAEEGATEEELPTTGEEEKEKAKEVSLEEELEKTFGELFEEEDKKEQE